MRGFQLLPQGRGPGRGLAGSSPQLRAELAVQEATVFEGMVEVLCYPLLTTLSPSAFSQVGPGVLRPVAVVAGGASVTSGFMGNGVLWNWDS